MKLVIMGPPGSGKGTQAKIIAEHYKLKHISSGDLFRAEMASGSELGKKLKEKYEKGLLIDSKLTFDMVKKALPTNNFLLDGFPRNVEQAEMLENYNPVDAVVYLDVSDEVIIDRITSRRKCGKCGQDYGLDHIPKVKDVCDVCKVKLSVRSDDKEEVVRERLNVYNESTAPLLEFYEDRLISVNGDNGVDNIFEEIKEEISELGLE